MERVKLTENILINVYGFNAKDCLANINDQITSLRDKHDRLYIDDKHMIEHTFKIDNINTSLYKELLYDLNMTIDDFKESEFINYEKFFQFIYCVRVENDIMI